MKLHILGLGPAGAIVGLRAMARGWEVHGYDPRGLHVWEETYGMLDEGLPKWFAKFLSPPQALEVKTPEPRGLPFGYRMLRNDALLAAVRGMHVHTQEMSPAEFPNEYVIDCRGAHVTDALWQVAVGFILPDAPGPLFMDWTNLASDSADSWPPSFLYVQPVKSGWLYEETILATALNCRRPEVRSELVTLLRTRLQQRVGVCSRDALRGGVDFSGEPDEVVFIPMGTRCAAPRNPLHRNFGARAGMINPATGYSVGAAAINVDALLDSLYSSGQISWTGKRTILHRGRWRIMRRSTWNTHLSHLLRNIGGQLIAVAGQETLCHFFDCFFRLPVEYQLAYLVGDDGVAVAKTMWRLRHETTMRHDFLKPLFRTPWRVIIPAWRRSFYTEKPR